MLVDQLLVDFAVLVLMRMSALQQRNPRRGIHHRQLREPAARIVQERLGSRSVDHQHIRFRKRNHVVRRQLEIVQAAGLRSGQADELHIADPLRQVQRRHIHRIKRRDDPRFFLPALRRTGQQRNHRRQRHNARHQQRHLCVNPFSHAALQKCFRSLLQSICNYNTRIFPACQGKNRESRGNNAERRG